MPSYSKVCLDANLIVRMHDPASLEYQHILDLLERCVNDRTVLIAPSLTRYEVTNALYRMAKGGLIRDSEATAILHSMNQLPISYYDGAALNRAAFEIARALDLKAAYDAHYLALSLAEGADFFTVDKRLVAAAQSSYGFVRYVMDL